MTRNYNQHYIHGSRIYKTARRVNLAFFLRFVSLPYCRPNSATCIEIRIIHRVETIRRKTRRPFQLSQNCLWSQRRHAMFWSVESKLSDLCGFGHPTQHFRQIGEYPFACCSQKTGPFLTWAYPPSQTFCCAAMPLRPGGPGHDSTQGPWNCCAPRCSVQSSCSHFCRCCTRRCWTCLVDADHPLEFVQTPSCPRKA